MRDRDRKQSEAFPRSLGGPINVPHEEAVEFAKHSKREIRVYVFVAFFSLWFVGIRLRQRLPRAGK